MRRADGWILLVALVALLGVYMACGGDGATTSVYVASIETVQDASIGSGGFLIDINTADAALLMELPGIGEVIAARIIEYREQNGPFDNPEELLNVFGIGESKLGAIHDFIHVK